MEQTLQEYVDSAGQSLRIDRRGGVLKGVKLLGLTSRNGRRYRPQALVEAVGLYEQAKVNVNHPPGSPLAPRDYRDRIGVIRGVRFEPGRGLFGDLYFNPKHALAEQLLWDAEHAAENVGFSHNVLARTSRNGEETIVEAIARVQSVDLVADPAATRGLFEQTDSSPSTDTSNERPPTWDALTWEQLTLHRPDLARELEQQHAELAADYRRRLDELAAGQAAAERRARIDELLTEHALPAPADEENAIISPGFVERLMQARDDQELCRLVEARAALVRSAARWQAQPHRGPQQPTSRGRFDLLPTAPLEKPHSPAEFAAAIRG